MFSLLNWMYMWSLRRFSRKGTEIIDVFDWGVRPMYPYGFPDVTACHQCISNSVGDSGFTDGIQVWSPTRHDEYCMMNRRHDNCLFILYRISQAKKIPQSCSVYLECMYKVWGGLDGDNRCVRLRGPTEPHFIRSEIETNELSWPSFPGFELNLVSYDRYIVLPNAPIWFFLMLGAPLTHQNSRWGCRNGENLIYESTEQVQIICKVFQGLLTHRCTHL